MIQFNLLPSVKMDYVKTKRTKHMTMLIATLVGGISLAIMVVLVVYVLVIQKKNSNDISTDIKTQSSELRNTTDLNKILTIQNQLGSLTGLHDTKPVTTRLLNYLKQITPANVSIDTLNIDFEGKTISMSGSADSLVDVNILVDTVKFATFKTSANVEGKAFSEVVSSGAGKNEEGAAYILNFKYDPIIFDSANDVSIIVQSGKTTTRSQTEKPLFKPTIDDSKDAQ